MAPKNKDSKAPGTDSKPESIDSTSKAPSSKTASTASSTKRKREPKSSNASNKTPRRSGRNPSANQARAPSKDPLALLNALLSSHTAHLCRPQHETDALSENPKLRTYTGTLPLTPFEELLAAAILSRPISHALGQRSLRYIINEPRNLNTPKAIQDTEEEKVHQWLVEAKTQHKAKTAQQIIGLADVCVDKKWVGEKGASDAGLDGLRGAIKTDGSNGVARLQEILKKEIKGMGATGVDIFVRRVQGVWGEVYPFVDARTAGALEAMGLPKDAEGMRKLIEEHWKSLEKGELGGGGEAEEKRLAYVKILERAIGAGLEGKVEEVLDAVETG